MKNMHFFRVFLLSVLPLTLAQPSDLMCLPYYGRTSRDFAILDKNNDNILDDDENIQTYFILRGNPTRNMTQVFKRLDYNGFFTRYGAFRYMNSTIATALFNLYNRDNNCQIGIWDFKLLRLDIDRNNDGNISREEYIRFYNQKFTNAKFPLRFKSVLR
ncbi:unnamed protein product [Lymnaea stagnalis]|uniref:EF-hand domain-containing protein n=1 Tax=Lymnaea stagnalis TaxID=6523 RepID=A0AAV2HST1_LYMST